MKTVALHSQHFGEPDAPPIVIAHGLLGSSTNWGSVARKLAQTHAVWLLDMRNHGRSPHATEMTYPAMAADINRFVLDNDLTDVTLLGHSMGGKAAMYLGLDRPEHIRQLVIVDIAPHPSPGDHRSVIDAMAQLDLSSIGSRKAADEALRPAIEEAALRGWLLQNLLIDDAGARWRVNVEVLAGAHDTLTDFPPPPTRATFDGRALFVRGAKSNYLLESDLDSVKSLFPQAQLVSIANAGHWVHAEQPAAFVDALQTFLGRATRARTR